MIVRAVISVGIFVVFILSLINFYQNVIKYQETKPLNSPKEKIQKVISTNDKAAADKITWDMEILEKNIFSPDRSFSPVQESETSEETEDSPIRPNLKLIGVVLNQYNEYIAYIKREGEKPVGLRVGERIDDSEIIEINDRTVKIRWKDEEFVLTLKNMKNTE